MTIGPEPMMQIECRSSRRGTEAHLLHPTLEDRPRVVRAGTRFGMELHRGGALVPEVESLYGAIVERYMRRFARVGGLDCEAVVLRSDEHASGRTLEHWVVRTAVPERELVRAMTGREREQLVPKANPEYRHPSHQVADRCNLLAEGLRVTGPIREQYAVEADELLGDRVVREDRHRRSCPGEPPEDRPLAAVVHDRDARSAELGVDIRLMRRHALGERASCHRLGAAGDCERLLDRGVARDCDRAHRTGLTQS